MMDFENACLSQNWDSSAHPRGPKRFQDAQWAKMIRGQVYPHNTDVDWFEYVAWVVRGGGDEWFKMESEQE